MGSTERAACSHTVGGSWPLRPREMQAGFAQDSSSAITGYPPGETLLNRTPFLLLTPVCGSD